MTAPVGRTRSELSTRVVVGAALIALAAVALWAGGLGFWLVLAVAGLLMMAEWADLAGATRPHKRIAQYALAVPLAAAAPIALSPPFLTLGLIGGAAFFVAAVTRRGRLGWGVVYVALPILSLVLLRGEADGLLLTFWAMALVWACDIGAFFAGRAIGGPKLAPRVSPSKTWSGLGGGVAAATLFAAILHAAFGLPLALVAATPLLAVLAQGGDLFESHLKRRAGVKDSGTILPGHGGVMDRLDGLVPVAPVAMLLVLAIR